MVTLLLAVTGVKAMGYEQAREQALFLTDKMAYELNLSEQQYEAAYEINLDYLMSVNTVDDLYSEYWRQRNLDMQFIFYDWQWDAFCAASYFYRPLYWDAGVWHFGIYAHYPVRTFYFYSRPTVWATYVGGHSWRYNGGRSWYVHHGPVYRVEHHRGMRHYAPAHHYSANPRPHFSHQSSGARIHTGNIRPSSTRSTVESGTSGSARGFSHTSGSTTSRSGSSNIGGSSSSRGSFSHGSRSSFSTRGSSGSYSSPSSRGSMSSSSGSFSRGSMSSSSGSFSRGSMGSSGGFSRGSGGGFSHGGGSRGSFGGSGSHGGGGSHGGRR